MQRSSSQKPVEGNPHLAEEQVFCPGRATSPLGLEGVRGPCPRTATPLLPLTSPPAPKSHSIALGPQEHFHAEILVLSSSSLPTSTSAVPESAPSLLVRFRISLVLCLEFSHMTTFSLCHIYFALKCSSKTLHGSFSPILRAQPISLA